MNNEIVCKADFNLILPDEINKLKPNYKLNNMPISSSLLNKQNLII